MAAIRGGRSRPGVVADQVDRRAGDRRMSARSLARTRRLLSGVSGLSALAMSKTACSSAAPTLVGGTCTIVDRPLGVDSSIGRGPFPFERERCGVVAGLQGPGGRPPRRRRSWLAWMAAAGYAVDGPGQFKTVHGVPGAIRAGVLCGRDPEGVRGGVSPAATTTTRAGASGATGTRPSRGRAGATASLPAASPRRSDRARGGGIGRRSRATLDR
jgi:hypothetical protein